jgi:hypothetical protein
VLLGTPFGEHNWKLREHIMNLIGTHWELERERRENVLGTKEK